MKTILMKSVIGVIISVCLTKVIGIGLIDSIKYLKYNIILL